MKTGPYIYVMVFLTLTVVINAYSTNENHLFATGKNIEIDRCASAWLIKRFVDPEAQFVFYPEGEFITQGTAFDTADAKLRRNHRQSTFETVKDYYKIKDARIAELEKCIHNLEINAWSVKRQPIAVKVDNDIRKIIDTSTDNQQCLLRCFKYFDDFIKSKKE